jgi:hypothetical protein
MSQADKELRSYENGKFSSDNAMQIFTKMCQLMTVVSMYETEWGGGGADGHAAC